MDSIPLVREVSSIFSISGGHPTSSSSQIFMRVAKYVYIILALVFVFGGCNYLFNTIQRPVAGVLFFLGATIAAYFYYVKFFVIPASKPLWPPYQTLCPDYLTPIAPGYTKDANGVNVPVGGPMKCVDFVGVSTNGLLKQAKPSIVQQQMKDSSYTFTVDPKMTRDDLKQLTQSYGLSWMSLMGDI